MTETVFTGQKPVLVVDDSPVNRKLAVAFLGRFGLAAIEATDGSEAIALLDRHDVDLVLLDISMPGMSGEEVLAHLRADERLSRLHVIAYTAHALPEEKQRLADAGFDGLLIKPVSLKEVESALIAYYGLPKSG